MKCLNELQVRRRNQLSFEHRFMTKMALTFISPLILLSVVMIVEIRAAPFCGETQLGTTGVILSPNYPNNYEDNTICEWSLTSSSNARIMLVIRDMETEKGVDFIRFYDGPSDQYPLLAALSGSYPDLAVYTRGSQGFVRFTSDYDTVGRGFNITWGEY